MAFAEIPDCTHWSFTKTVDTTAQNTSDTAGFKRRTIGPSDWTATITQLTDGTGAVFAEGDTVNLEFYEYCNDRSLYTGQKWTGTAVCSNIAVSEPIDGGGPITYTYSLEGKSALTYSQNSGPSGPYGGHMGLVRWEAA